MKEQKSLHSVTEDFWRWRESFPWNMFITSALLIARRHLEGITWRAGSREDYWQNELMGAWRSSLPRYHQYATSKLGVLWDSYNSQWKIPSLPSPESPHTRQMWRLISRKQDLMPNPPSQAFISSLPFTGVYINITHDYKQHQKQSCLFLDGYWNMLNAKTIPAGMRSKKRSTAK